AERAGEDHPSRVPGRDRAAAERGQVEAEMRLLVDRLPAIDIAAAIGETRERRGVREAEELALPERARHAVATDLAHAAFGGGTQLAVDAEVARDEVPGLVESVRLQQLGDFAREEFLGDGQ